MQRNVMQFIPSGQVTAGLMSSRLAEGGNPLKGPLALGYRLQDSGRIADTAEFDACVAHVLSRPGAGGGSDESAVGGNFELRSNLQVPFLHFNSIPEFHDLATYFRSR